MKTFKEFLNEEDEMTPKEVIEILDKVKRKISRYANEWSFRDMIKEYTSWGFYKGSSMVSIDTTMAIDIFNQLMKAVKSGVVRDQESLWKIYDDFSRFSR